MMMKIIPKLFLVLCFLMGVANSGAQVLKANKMITETKEIKSNFINESYVVSVSLPQSYDGKKKFPVVFLVDSNLYFDIMAQVLRSYHESTGMPEAILVGVGYADYATTDKLRSRDFTYPASLPEYKVPMLTGGAKEFLGFINTQVVPYIDANYVVDTSNRILMGHSLGGYFSIFAMYENLIAKKDIFAGYIAGSPTLFYNNNYLIDQFANANLLNQNKTKTYVTFGGSEDAEFSAMVPIKRADVLNLLDSAIKTKNQINYTGEIYTHLAHTDTPLPTFIKGINGMLKK